MSLYSRSMGPIALMSVLAAGCASSDSPGISSAGSSSGNLPGGSSSSLQAARNVLVFSSQGRLVQVDQQGANPRILTPGPDDSDPFFEPSGANLIFCRRSGSGKQDIYRMNPDGSNPINLTDKLPFDCFSPCYSWDGRLIVFYGQTADGDRDIYQMTPDGTQLRHLTQGLEMDSEPAFSSDRDAVVFERNTTPGKSKICRLDLADGKITDLTIGTYSDRSPSYCPPGDTVIFSRDGKLLKMQDTHVPGDLSSLTPADSGVTHARHNQEHDSIYFVGFDTGAIAKDVRAKAGDSEIFVTTNSGTGTRQLTQGAQATSVTAAPAADPGPAPNQVTVELVNDSGLTDDQVFILLDTPESSGQAVQGPPTLLTNSGTAGSNGTAVPFSSLKATGQKVRSKYTGKLEPIYSFKVDNLRSGHVKISYKTAVKIVDGANPTAAEKYRFDKLELTYLSADKGGGGNLTSIDFFGIPLEVNVTHWGASDADPLQTKTFYLSTKTLLAKLNALGANMKNAVLDLSGKPLDPANPGDLSTFARILSPNTIAASVDSAGSPAPYPSFDGYLKSLVGKEFTLNGQQHGGYNYTAKVASDGNGGYVVNCSGTLNVAAPSPLPNNAAVQVKFPKGFIDFYTYACVANKDSYSITGYPFVDTSGSTADDKVKQANETPYGSMVGDVQAALNFGYVNGVYGTAMGTLYRSVVLPYPYPYGGARTTNDGYYNPFASLFYYFSDAYGHPYSDRIDAASPLYKLQPGDTARITVLNDARLDTPIASLTGQKDTTLDLSWPAVPGASGYSVEVSPSPGTAQTPVTVGKDPITYQLTGLKPGTPYLVSVKAVDNSKADVYRESAVLPVQGVTTGVRAPLNATGLSGAVKFQANLNLPPELTGYKIKINGNLVNPTQNSEMTGALGTNVVGLHIENAQGAVVYQGNYLLSFLAATAADRYKLGKPYTLENNLTPLTAAPVQPDYPRANAQLVVGTPFTPKPFFKFFQTLFP